MDKKQQFAESYQSKQFSAATMEDRGDPGPTLVSGHDLQTNDIVFGVPGSEENECYLNILDSWWATYERSGHVEKRSIADAAVQELFAAGVRFLVPYKNRASDVYVLLPRDSRKLMDKVMRQLRKIIRQNTAHLTEDQATNRKHMIKKQRRAKAPTNMGTKVDVTTWDSIWENDNSQDLDNVDIDNVDIDNVDPLSVLSVRVPHGATDTSTQAHGFQWPSAFERSRHLVGPSAAQGNLYVPIEDGRAHSSRNLDTHQERNATVRPRADSDNLDLSNVFDDTTEETRSDGFSFETLVCPLKARTSSTNSNSQPIEASDGTLMELNEIAPQPGQPSDQSLLDVLAVDHPPLPEQHNDHAQGGVFFPVDNEGNLEMGPPMMTVKNEHRGSARRCHSWSDTQGSNKAIKSTCKSSSPESPGFSSM